jgi:hypothetical protein
VAVLLAVPLAAPGAARADGMCVVVHDYAFEVGVLDSVDPAELETADPAASNEDPGAPHLLCTSGNDPRCSPLHAPDSPSTPDLPGRVVALPFSDAVGIASGAVAPVERTTTSFGDVDLLGPAAGARSGLERPPRA